MKRRLVGEARFHTLGELARGIEGLTYGRNTSLDTSNAYVKVFENEDLGHATRVRLWEETLSDGSTVYELHIL